MSKLNLLIVDDDTEVIKSYERDIKSFNLASEVKIDITVITNKSEAIDILNTPNANFDAAIIDLRLDEKGKSDDEHSGNEVIRQIKNKLRFPVFVITGTPHEIAEDLKDENSFFRIKTRGEQDNYLEQFVAIFNTGITKILGKRRAN